MIDNTFGSGRESSLHSEIKKSYSVKGDKLEARVGGFVVDIVRGDLLIEVQTANFSALKPKLMHLLGEHKIRIVYPIPELKWVVHRSTSIEEFGRRRSPKKGHLSDVFKELIRIPSFFSSGNLSIEVLMIEEEEIWRHDGKGSWRRKGASIEDRRLIRILESEVFEDKQDFLKFLPNDLHEPFSNRDLAERLRTPVDQCRRITYTLSRMGMITRVSMRGNQMLFARAAS